MAPIDICGRCFRNGTSCCTTRTEDKKAMIRPPVSAPERQAILHFFSDKKMESLFERQPNTLFFIRRMQTLFPDMKSTVMDRFPRKAHHWVLKTRDNACALLGPDGCVLPVQARPHFCRIYPFWFFGETPHIFQDSDCLALTAHETVAEVFLCLGTYPEKLKQIHERICLNLELFPSRIPVRLNSL